MKNMDRNRKNNHQFPGQSFPKRVTNVKLIGEKYI